MFLFWRQACAPRAVAITKDCLLKAPESSQKQQSSFWLMLLLIFVVLSVLFRYSYLPGYTAFSNDSPLAAFMSDSHKMPEVLTGGWQDLNSIGIREGTWPNIGQGILWLIGPLGFSKFHQPIALLILGLGAWCFFRQLKFAPVACILGGLAAMLNSGFFSVACWGISAHTVMVGMNFFALAALIDTTSRRRWLRVALAGLAVGMGVAEAADVGAIFSLYIAAFVLYQAWTAEGVLSKRIAGGLSRLAVLTGFAVFLAAQAISGLVGTAIQGISGTGQDTQSKEQRWDFATQWSLPKREALTLFIPGLFGYRLDTPREMSSFESAYEGGVYWGGVGRDPAWDHWFASGRQGPAPEGFLRHTGGGVYTGILVVMIALWTSFQSLRKEKSVFSLSQRKWIWFWSVLVFVSLLLSFGRHAPFYRLFYALPYASTIRNPGKFLALVCWGLVVLFGYGVHGLSRRYLDASARAISVSLSTHLKSWWTKLSGFDRRWIIGCILVLAASIVGGLIYSSSRQTLEVYLQGVGFSDLMAKQIASFSLGSVGWYLVLLLLATGLLILVLSGWFAGRRAKMGGIFLGVFLVLDLARANQPWILVWDYQQKYASNPIIDFFRQKPYEHRVVSLPRWLTRVFNLPQQLASAEQYFQQIYGIEWAQHLFLYYNIQSLDVVQMPRMPEDLAAFEGTLQPRTGADLSRLVPRRWELTNTRYLLGPVGFLELLNNYIDTGKHRFRIVQQFDISPKAGVSTPTQLQELTAVPSTNGNFAIFEFTGALPRAKLYANWQITTNSQIALQRLASAEFDPAQQVLVSEPIAQPAPASATNENPGTVEFKSYSPNRIILSAKAYRPSVLLLNDRFDPNWKLWVDGKPQSLLHCNFIMRGVYLQSGEHTVDFRFESPALPRYISLTAIAIGLALLGFLAFSKSEDKVAPSPEAAGKSKLALAQGK